MKTNERNVLKNGRSFLRNLTSNIKGAIITNKGRHRIPNPLDHNGIKAIEVKWVSLTVPV